MRALSQEEISYLAENDITSLARIPVIATKMDNGNYIYDKSDDRSWDGRIIHASSYVLKACKDRIPKDSYSLTLVFADVFTHPMFIATIDMGQYIPLKERMEKGIDYPASLVDICRIGMMSGAHTVSFVFNHPEQDISGFKSPKVCEEEMLLAYFASDFPMPNVSYVLGVNMAKDPSRGFENATPKYWSNFYHKGDVKRALKDSSYVYMDFIHRVKKDHSVLNQIFDYSLGGKLPGMDKSHIESWLFYTDRFQKEPIRYEEWKMGEIPFTAELLAKPAKDPYTKVNSEAVASVVSDYLSGNSCSDRKKVEYGKGNDYLSQQNLDDYAHIVSEEMTDYDGDGQDRE